MNKLLLAAAFAALTACADREPTAVGQAPDTGTYSTAAWEIDTDDYTEIARILEDYPELKPLVQAAFEDGEITNEEYIRIRGKRSELEKARAKTRAKRATTP